MLSYAPPPPSSFVNASMSFAVSESALFAKSTMKDAILQLKKTFTLGSGIEDSIHELVQVYSECRNNDWDGYGAERVGNSSYELAWALLDVLPAGTPPPTIGAEPDGQLTLEWYRAPYRTLSVSVDPLGELHYAALLGVNKQYGTEQFSGDHIPQPILDLVSRVMSA